MSEPSKAVLELVDKIEQYYPNQGDQVIKWRRTNAAEAIQDALDSENEKYEELCRKYMVENAKLKSAVTQMLDDGGYIESYDDNDNPIVKPEAEQPNGGSFCHAAALMGIEALGSEK